jgi:hypothetical protein
VKFSPSPSMIDAIDQLGTIRVSLRISKTFYYVLGSSVAPVPILTGLAPPQACSPATLR